MEQLPFYVTPVFILATLYSIFAFFASTRHSKKLILVLIGWCAAQLALAFSGFYLTTYTLPPRFLLAIGPPLLLITFYAISGEKRKQLARFDLRWLTLLHIVRIPVELVLFWLYKAKLVPELMTFDGINFDILSGITAAMVYYLVFVKKTSGRKLLLAWNIAALVPLFNIVTHALLAAPTPFQQIAFDQPNIAVFHGPFILLPALIVPLVLAAHVAAILQLVKKNSYSSAASRTGATTLVSLEGTEAI